MNHLRQHLSKQLRVVVALMLLATTAAVASAIAPASAQGGPTPVDPTTLDETPLIQAGVRGFVQPSVPQNWRVHAFAEIGDRVYVGGSFTTVRDLPYANAMTHAQPFLAAFDLDTNDFISEFAPVLDDAVWALEVYNGNLIVGGEFDNVNGVAREGLVTLDPTTGATISSFDASIGNAGSNYEASVRALEVIGDELYVVGDFNRIYEGGNAHGQFRTGRLNAATGNLDQTFDPYVFGGAVFDIAVDTVYDKIYLVGSFSSVNGAPGTVTVGVVSPTDGSTLPNHEFVPNRTIWRTYGVDLLEDEVWIGGEQHAVMVHDRDTWTNLGCFLSGFTGDPDDNCNAPVFGGAGGGGDYQVMEAIDDFVLTGCHCRGPLYSEFTGQTINLLDRGVRLYDDTALDIDFWPGATIWNEGPYAAMGDSNGCLYIGGDFTGTVDGFARYCTPEPTVPFGPPNAVATVDGNDISIDWSPSEDTKGYLVHLDYVFQQFSTNPGYTTNLPDGTYRFDIRAQRPDNTFSAPTTLIVTVGDVEPLTTPENVTGTINGTTIELAWDPVGPAAGYLVHSNWQFVSFVSTNSYDHTNLTVGETYRYQIRAQDAAGANSDPSPILNLTIPGPVDDEPPTTPTNLQATLNGANTEIDLTWNASTDNVGVTGYLVHRNWQFYAYVTGTTYTDDNLQPATRHRYQIRAQDAAGNTSAPTAIVGIDVP